MNKGEYFICIKRDRFGAGAWKVKDVVVILGITITNHGTEMVSFKFIDRAANWSLTRQRFEEHFQPYART